MKAIIWSLNKKDLPSNSLDRILSGFADASQPDFKALCTSQKALLITPFYSLINKGVDTEQLIHSTLTCLEAKYFELSSADEWNGSAEATNSAFLGAAGPPSNQNVYEENRLKFEVWKKKKIADGTWEDRLPKTPRPDARKPPTNRFRCRKCGSYDHKDTACPNAQNFQKLGLKSKDQKKAFLQMLEEEEAQTRALVTELDEEEFSDNDSDADPDVDNDSDGSTDEGIGQHSAHAARAFGSLKH